MAAACRAGAAVSVRGIPGFGLVERPPFLRKAGERRIGVGKELILAPEIGGQLDETALGFGAGREHVPQFLLEAVAGLGQPLQLGRGPGFGEPQRRQRLFGRFAPPPLGERALAELGDGPLRHAQVGGAALGLGLGREPARIEQQRLGPPDVLAEAAVTLRLARLLLQRLELRLDRRDHVVEPQQVGRGRLEPLLGFAAACLQAGGTGGVFEEEAAFGRLGLDQRADSRLADQRPGPGAGSGIGEQQLHIARPHLAPVDPIGRAAAALDAAQDFDLVSVVEGKGRVAGAVVEAQRDLGDVARRPPGGAGEDHIVHGAAAQAPRRGLAHNPAQRFGQVRFAATVRADDPGQAGLDRQLGAVNERFEPEKAKPLDLHRPPRAPAPALPISR